MIFVDNLEELENVVEITDEDVLKEIHDMPRVVEDLRNKLNLEIRVVLSIIDMIDGKTRDYEDYEEYSLIEKDYLEQQLDLVSEIKDRLREVFK